MVEYNSVAGMFNGLLPLQHYLARKSNKEELLQTKRNVDEFQEFLLQQQTTHPVLGDGHETR